MFPAVETAPAVAMTDPLPTTAATEIAATPTAGQHHAESTMGRIYGKIVRTTGAIQTATTSIPEIQAKSLLLTPIPALKIPAQRKGTEEKSRVRKISERTKILL